MSLLLVDFCKVIQEGIARGFVLIEPEVGKPTGLGIPSGHIGIGS